MVESALDDRSGELISDGVRISIVGPPNAGKSSLINLLAKRDVAIVTDVPGTTRDAISATLNLDGMKVEVIDTAGIRSTEDQVE